MHLDPLKIKELYMKKILLMLSFICCISVYASDSQIVLYGHNNFDRFYTKDSSGWVFSKLEKKQIKQLDPESKKVYKNIVSADKLWKQAMSTADSKKKVKLYNKAIKRNPELHPVSYNLLVYYFTNEKYFRANRIYTRLKDLGLLSNYDMAYFMGGALNYKYKNYNESISLLNEYLTKTNIDNNTKILTYYYLTSANFIVGRNQDVIKNADNLLNLDKSYQLICSKYKYASYYKLHNLNAAKQEALILVKLEPNSTNYYNLAISTTNDNEKLSYLKKAKSLENNEKIIFNMNQLMAPIEQKKINAAVKTCGAYVNKPTWSEFYTPKRGDIAYWNKRYNAFIDQAYYCMNNYKGKDLAYCFNDLKSSETRKDDILRQEHYVKAIVSALYSIDSTLEHQNKLIEEQNSILTEQTNAIMSTNNILRDVNWNIQGIKYGF